MHEYFENIQLSTAKETNVVLHQNTLCLVKSKRCFEWASLHWQKKEIISPNAQSPSTCSTSYMCSHRCQSLSTFICRKQWKHVTVDWESPSDILLQTYPAIDAMCEWISDRLVYKLHPLSRESELKYSTSKSYTLHNKRPNNFGIFVS